MDVTSQKIQLGGCEVVPVIYVAPYLLWDVQQEFDLRSGFIALQVGSLWT